MTPTLADDEMVETQIGRLTVMYRTVADRATDVDCVSATILTRPDGALCVEYGSFTDGERLNIPTAASDSRHTVSDIIDRVDRDPLEASDSDEYVVYDVDDLEEIEVAELTVTAADGWDGLDVAQADIKTIQNLPDWWPELLSPWK